MDVSRPDSNLPKFIYWILKRLYVLNQRDGYLGDIEEEYREKRTAIGKRKAGIWLRQRAFQEIPRTVAYHLIWGIEMFKNYLMIAFRNIKKHISYSIINVFSFTIALSCSMLILLYIQSELRYDDYHENAQNIYRVLREYPGESSLINSSEHPLAATLKNDFPEVIRATRIKKNDEIGIVEYQSEVFNEEAIYFVDQDFLNMFTFPALSGDPNSALIQPFSVVLTQNMAQKYFGTDPPVGKTLRIQEWYSDRKRDYTVMAVVENVPSHSHFTFDFLISYNTLYSLKRGGRESVETWAYFEPKTYIQLDASADSDDLESKFPNFLTKHKRREPDSEWLRLQRLTDIHLGGNMQFELERNSHSQVITLFSVVSLLIVIIAGLNYINLSVARSTKRAMEVGMRKVLGAIKPQLFRQFMSESLIIAMIALVFSLLLVGVLLPGFSSFVNRDLTFNILDNPGFILLFLGLALTIGLFSGIYPSLFISSFRPIQIMKRSLIVGSKKQTSLRGVLLTVQFIISIVMMVCSLTIQRQVTFIRNQDLGFDKEHILTVYTMDRNLSQNPDVLKQQLLSHPEILGVSTSLDLPTTIRRYMSVEYDDQGLDLDFGTSFTFIDYDFLSVYGIGVVDGRNFAKEFTTDDQYSLLINESAAAKFGLTSPVGIRVHMEGRDWTVIGVIEDFHYKSLHWEIEPSVFLLNTNRGLDYFSIKIGSNDISGTIAFIREQWKQFSDGYPFEYTFLDSRIDQRYQAEDKLEQSIRVLTLLAITIACLGLIGLVSFIAEHKKKEIGIRKVLGADVKRMIVLISKDLMKCLILALLIASPIGYFVMENWLKKFAYRTSIGIDLFILSAAVTFIIAFLTIGHQIMKAARTNPVETIKYE